MVDACLPIEPIAPRRSGAGAAGSVEVAAGAATVFFLANVLPFRYTLGFPVETLTGGLSRSDALAQLAVQYGYAAAAVLGAAALWRAGTRRYQAYGG